MDESLKKLVLDLCGGNPGCIRTLAEIGAERLDRLVKIRDLGYKGPFIWLIRKDLLGGDLVRFGNLLDNDELEAVIERRLEEDENFARQWRYHEAQFPPRMKGGEV